MRFSYIICYRHNSERFKNLSRILDWLDKFENIEVIVVEQDDSSKLSIIEKYKFDINHIFTFSNYPFNRSWAFNVGLKESNSEIVIFGDSDLICDVEQFNFSLKELETSDCVSPYKSVLDLTKEESELDIEDWKKIERPGRGETDNQKINLTGGIVLYKKSSILKIGGWDENFIGWGGEDDWQSRKTILFLKFKEMPFRCYHLFHEKVVPDLRFYQRTLYILNQLMQLPKEIVIQYIEKNMNNIGEKDKYQKMTEQNFPNNQ